ncbi:MAG: M16 family metallopeptidase, partial [Bryobacteraceae bacterium]
MRAALLLAAALPLVAADVLVKHPRELKFNVRSFTPPRAAEFRHRLSSGAVAFLVEDHELPLVNVSVIIRTGEYLDPEGKTGVADLTGSQIRSGGTRTRPPADFDEEAAFIAANLASSISGVAGNASLNCLAKDLDAGMALFADMLRNPAFDDGRLKLARSQMLQSMARRNDNTGAIE